MRRPKYTSLTFATGRRRWDEDEDSGCGCGLRFLNPLFLTTQHHSHPFTKIFLNLTYRSSHAYAVQSVDVQPNFAPSFLSLYMYWLSTDVPVHAANSRASQLFLSFATDLARAHIFHLARLRFSCIFYMKFLSTNSFKFPSSPDRLCATLVNPFT